MTTTYRYAVVRLVPDEIRQEFVNVGVVIAPMHGHAYTQFAPKSEARRLTSLGYEGDFETLRSVERDIRAWGDHAALYLEEASQSWAGTLRFSELGAARHETPKALLEELYARYVHRGELVDPLAEAPRDRRYARRLVQDALRAVLPPEAIQKRPLVPGNVESHKFDAGVKNGKLLHAVTTLSFDIKTERVLAGEVDAGAWSISDVREKNPDLPISVVTVGRAQRKLLNRAHEVYSKLGATIVNEDQLDNWAGGVRDNVEPHLAQASASPVVRNIAGDIVTWR